MFFCDHWGNFKWYLNKLSYVERKDASVKQGFYFFFASSKTRTWVTTQIKSQLKSESCQGLSARYSSRPSSPLTKPLQFPTKSYDKRLILFSDSPFWVRNYCYSTKSRLLAYKSFRYFCSRDSIVRVLVWVLVLDLTIIIKVWYQRALSKKPESFL